jgi:Flp pilus assembly protein TadG
MNKFAQVNSRKFLRSSCGVLGTPVFLIGILISLLFACFSIDLAHFAAAKAEMQTVADSAALMGAYKLQWLSTAINTAQATADARYMARHGFADIYSPGGLSIPDSAINVSFSSLNGGVNNAVTVTITPPITFIFAALIGNMGQAVGVSATAERLPILAAPAPPWFLETTAQLGPLSPSPLPSPAPPPPLSFPVNAYVTFYDGSQLFVKKAPPLLPTFWVDMGLSELSTAQSNPSGIQSVIQCKGRCISNTLCNTTNPIVVNLSEIFANHGAYDSNISNPRGNAAYWTDGSKVILPVTLAGRVIDTLVVKLTGPYVPDSYASGQGVFGEFGVQFLGSADSMMGVSVMDPSQGAVYANVGATKAVLIK